MPIEYKFGPPISALGRMAYAVGAGEAAKKRALEERERRMQMMRMQQQQQEAARNRQFDVWRNQYQHGSAMQRMQADHEWRDNNQKRGWEHEKTRFDYETETKFKNDTELNRLRGAENERVNRIDHLQTIEREKERAKNSGDQAAIRRADIEYEVGMRSIQDSCSPDGRTKFTEYNGQISDIMVDDRLNDKQKQDKIQGIRKQQLELPKLYPKRLEDPGYHDVGEVFTTDNVNGQIIRSLSEGVTTDQYKAAVNWKPEKYKDKDGLWETTLEVGYDPDKKAIVPISDRKYLGESEETKRKLSRERTEHRQDLSRDFFKVEHVPVMDEETGIERMVPRVSVTAAGIDAVNRSGIKNFDPMNPVHQQRLVSFGMQEWEGAPGETGAPGGLFNVPSELPPGIENRELPPGVQEQLDNTDFSDIDFGVLNNPRPGAAPVERAADEEQAAAQDPVAALAAQDVDADEERIKATAHELSPAFTQEAGRVRPEEARLNREQVLSQRGGAAGRPDRQSWADVAGGEALTSPMDPLTGMSTTGRGARAELGAFGREAVKQVTTPVRKIAGGLKKVAEKAAEAETAASRKIVEKLGSRGRRNIQEKKQEASARKERQPGGKLHKALLGGKPGTIVPTPKTPSVPGRRHVPVTRSNDKSEYDKFHKEVRNYAHRLKNNKDASKDVGLRLDRLEKRGEKITREELDDELRIITAVMRVTGVGKKKGRWKDLLAKGLTASDINFKPGARPTSEYALKYKHWLTDMRQLERDLKSMGL